MCNFLALAGLIIFQTNGICSYISTELKGALRYSTSRLTLENDVYIQGILFIFSLTVASANQLSVHFNYLAIQPFS